MKEAIRKATKTEISVTRDLFIRAHPDLLQASESGAIVTPAPPPPAPSGSDAVTGETTDAGKSPEEKYVPPQWAVEAEEESGDPMSSETVRANILEVLPFKDDTDIWDVMRCPGAHLALIELVDGGLPDDVERVTTNSAYAKHLVTSIFAESYTEDHMIPKMNDPAPGEEGKDTPTLPVVSKRVLSVLKTITGRYASADFKVNTFWEQVREYFPEVCSTGHTGKPTVCSLLQQGQAAFIEEEQVAKAAKIAKSKASFDEFVRQMQEYKSSEDDDSPDPPAGHNLTALGPGLETTIGQAILEEHLTVKHESRVTRKRATGEGSGQDSKKSRKGEKK